VSEVKNDADLSGFVVYGMGLRLLTCLLELRVRIPLGAWISVSFECFVLSGRVLCDGLIAHPEESY
jgi:hypothetical protein